MSFKNLLGCIGASFILSCGGSGGGVAGLNQPLVLDSEPTGRFEVSKANPDQRPLGCGQTSQLKLDKRLKAGFELTTYSARTINGQDVSFGPKQTRMTLLKVDHTKQITESKTAFNTGATEAWVITQCSFSDGNTRCDITQQSPNFPNAFQNSQLSTETEFDYCYIRGTDSNPGTHDFKSEYGQFTLPNGRVVEAYREIMESTGEVSCFKFSNESGEEAVEIKKGLGKSYSIRIVTPDIPNHYGLSCNEEDVFSFHSTTLEDGASIEAYRREILDGKF